MLRVAPADLVDAVVVVLAQAGVPEAVARVEASIMVDAERCGVPSHGVLMLARLVAGLRDGRANPSPRVRVLREFGAVCVLDGDRGPGRYVSAAGMDHAVARARAQGVGLCLAVHTTHWGRAHAYAARAAAAGCIGLCTTNAMPTMMAPGLPRAVLGNNPVAIGVPRGGGRDPVVLDLALTQAALGKVATFAREGRPIPADWGADRTGAPTEDPREILASGLLLPMGGHKGIGLSVMIELLTAALAGGPFGHEMAAADASGLDPDATKLFLAVAPSAAGDAAAFERRVEALLDYLDALPTDAVAAPGDRGWRTRDDYDREGIPLHQAVVAPLLELGVRLRGQTPGSDSGV